MVAYILRYFPKLPWHKPNSERYALTQLLVLQKTLSQFTRLDQQQIFSNK